MPVYEYKCAACSHRFERWEKISAPTVQACPDCGEPAHRQIGAPALQFKGSGWYVTDYAAKGADGGSAKSEGTAKSEAKSESTGTSSSESSSGSKEGSGSGDSSKNAAA